ncbi:MAG: hypothetical protein ISR56_11510 [Bacteroidales bacterium]|nr:hypothetical protein [Bacteroidales bacterium]
MENDSIGNPLKETLEEFKTYIENQVTYNKLVVTKKAGEFSSYLLMLILILGFSGFVLLFLSFAFAGWFGEITKLGIGTGYLVMAGFYAILGIIVFIYRKPLIFNPIRKFFGNIFFGDEGLSGKSHAFESEQSLSENIKKAHDGLIKQKETLTQKINDLGHSFTFTNIANQIVGKAYNSMMTTSSIAKFTYKLVKKIKWFTERKKRRALKHKENKLLNEDND